MDQEYESKAGVSSRDDGQPGTPASPPALGPHAEVPARTPAFPARDAFFPARAIPAKMRRVLTFRFDTEVF